MLRITYGAMSRFALQKCSSLAQMLLANLLIARVMLSLRFINEKLKSKHRSSIYFFVRWQKLI
jgi:hypothetical protein